MKKNSGITLIALVITIVIMLILATISVTMLSGDNSLIKNAGEAKEGAEEKNEKDIINLAVTAVMNNNVYGELVASELADELNTNYGKDSKGEDRLTANVTGKKVQVVFSKSSRKYKIDSNGIVKKVEDVPAGDYGYIDEENCFIGQKSTYTWTDDVTGESFEEINNTQIANWNVSKNGYVFTEGHFVHIEDYNGLLWVWDEEQEDFVEKTGADVYLCWDGYYGTITSEQDLIDYANNNSTTTHWDIFDASSGAWLYNGQHTPGEMSEPSSPAV